MNSGPLPYQGSALPLSYNSEMSGKRGSNPRPPAWKASALSTELFPQHLLPCLEVGGDGFEPPKSKDNRFTVCPIWPLWKPPLMFQPHACQLSLSRASCRIRTNDPEITNHVLWPTELKRLALSIRSPIGVFIVGKRMQR